MPWKALLAVTAERTSQMGATPRSRAAEALSTTRAAAPMPTSIPCRRRSKGRAASSSTASVAAAPEARKPAPIHCMRRSELAASAETTITRRQRPARIQSSARPMAWVVLAQAALTCVFGPRAPMCSANCEWPIGEDAEEEAAIEDEALLLQERVLVLDPPVELREGGRGRSRELLSQVPEQGEPFAACPVHVEAREVGGEGVEAGEGGSEDDAGVVAERVGQHEAVGEGRPLRGRLVAHHERKARVAQGVEAGPDGEPGDDVEGGNPLGGDAELLLQVEGARLAGELDHLGHAVDRLEVRLALLALDEAHDVLVRHPLLDAGREGAR